jgi:5-formyltetrahydrofolate cyclo-ligase
MAGPDKSELRRLMRVRRAHLARANPEAARQAAALLPEAIIASTGIVAGYRPHGDEIDPWPVLERFVAAGAQLALPAVAARGEPLVFRSWRHGEALAPDALGIAAPLASHAEVRPDLVIAPLVAFDRRGGRLGQGGGYFDRTLAALRASGPVFVVGLAFAGQEVGDVGVEAHDQRLDAILTERAYTAFA